MLALYSLSNDAAQAGWGLNDTLVAGCNTSFTDANGYALDTLTVGGVASTPLAAVLIQSNGANPDRISLYTGTSEAAVGSVKTAGKITAGDVVIPTSTASPYGFAVGDVLLVAPEPATAANSRCSVVQMSGTLPVPKNDWLTIAAGATMRFNPAGGMPNAYALGGGRVFNLGRPERLSFHTWSLAGGVLLLRATDLAGAETAPVSVIDNIVSIKAQYGFDARVLPNYNPALPPTGNGMQVTQWSSTMIDADSDGTVGDPGDFQRVAAVRLAVVARAKSVEKPGPGGCTSTATLPTVFGTAAPAAVAAVPVQVNVAVTGDTIDWKCYRYRVFETIVPIRNAQWRPS
jgi:type IV pilus assembly protein PilW